MKTSYITKGLSIDQPLLDKVLAKAEKEDRTFSYICRQAIRRDLEGDLVAPNPAPDDELISTQQLATRLKCSVSTILRRARTPGDVLFRAKSKVGNQRPQQFRRSKIEEIERAA